MPMTDQDNVPVEKIALDFSEELNDNPFGIQDTQLLASKDLQTFLLSDPEKVKATEEKKPETKIETKAPVEEKDGKKVEEKDIARETLENLLNGDKDEDDIPIGVDKSNPTNPNTSEDDTYNTFAKDFLRLGVFTKNSEEETEENIDVKTPEQFLERARLEQKKGAINILEGFLGQFGEEYRKMFDAVFVNGVKPEEYLQSFAKIEAMAGLDLSSESNQERVVRAYYRDLKWDDAKIENKISKLKDYGDLEEESKAYHEVLLNKEKDNAAMLEQKKAADIQAQKEKDATTKRSIQRILGEKLKNQEIDGIPLTQKEVEETTEYLTEKKYKLPSGELLSEYDKDLLQLNLPENHENKIKLGLLLKRKLDLTAIKKATISKKSDALFTLSTKNAKENKSKEEKTRSFFS